MSASTPTVAFRMYFLIAYCSSLISVMIPMKQFVIREHQQSAAKAERSSWAIALTTAF